MNFRVNSVIFAILGLLSGSVGYGMEIKPNLISPEKTSAFFPNPHNDGGLDIVTQSLDKTTPKDKIYGQFFCFTDTCFAKILAERQKSGTDVSLVLSSTMRHFGKPAHKILENAGVNVHYFNEDSLLKKNVNNNKTLPQSLHDKTLIWTYTDKQGNKHYRTWDGSRNPSWASKQPSTMPNKNANRELNTYSNDKETYNKFLQHHEHVKNLSSSINKENLINYDNNPALDKTPTKKQILFSYQHNICKSIADRISNIDNYKKMSLSIYALDHPDIKKALEKANYHNKIDTLIIDQGTLRNTETRTFLESLTNVNIFVWNPAKDNRVGRCPTQCHMKGFVRQNNNDEYLVGVGSTNCTKANNNDINNFSFIPKTDQEDNTQMAEEITHNFEQIANQCVPLDKALPIIDEHIKKEKEKKQAKKITKRDNSEVKTKKRKVEKKPIKRALFPIDPKKL